MTGRLSRIERLSAFDLTNLAVEAPDTPMHVGMLAVLDGPSLLDVDGRIRTSDVHDRIRSGPASPPEARRLVPRHTTG